MKRILYSIIGGIMLVSSCNKEETKGVATTDSLTDGNQEEVVEEIVEEEVATPAVSLYKTWMRKEANGKSYKEVIYAAELSILDTTSVEGKLWYKVKVNNSGDEGWLRDYAIFENGSRAVVTQKTKVLKTSDLLAEAVAEFEPGEIILVSNEDKGGYYKVAIEKNKKKGYINGLTTVSKKDEDLYIGSRYYTALQKEGEEQVKAIEELMEEPIVEKSVFKTRLRALQDANIEAEAAAELEEAVVEPLPEDELLEGE